MHTHDLIFHRLPSLSHHNFRKLSLLDIICFPESEDTNRGADPHIGIDVLAIQYLAVTATLLCTELILIATIHLGVSVITAVLFTRVVAVQIHFVHDVSLEQLLQLGVSFV